jgi:uncharacterized paraquat-inducible protein A
MANIQAKVAMHKEANPLQYCPTRKCLWHTNPKLESSTPVYCPRHSANLYESWRDSKND